MEYGVKTTLHAKLKNLSSLECKKGPSTVLIVAEEEEIVKWILFCGERGFPVTKYQILLDCVQRFTMNDKRKIHLKITDQVNTGIMHLCVDIII